MLCVLAFAALVPSGAVHAQHQIVLDKLTQWNAAAPQPGNDTLEREVLKAADLIYDAVESCPDSSVQIERVQPATAERFVFASLIRNQLRNAWMVTAVLPGCDPAPVRYMVIQNLDNSLRTIRVNRGASYAWDSLIGDTLPLAQIGAAAALKRNDIECEIGASSKLGVTRIVDEGPSLGADVFGVRYTGTWSEIWPIEICGRTVEVRIDFTADGDGGAYTSIPGDAVSVAAQ